MSKVISAHSVSVDGYISGRTPEARDPATAGGRRSTRRNPPALRGGPMILVTGGLGMIGAHTARG
jgi:hypothetical protein